MIMMLKCRSALLVFSACLTIGAASAFVVQQQPQNKPFSSSTTTTAATTTTALYGGSSGYATTLEGKKATVVKVAELLHASELVFTVPASSLKVSQVQKLRGALPPGTTMQVIKNKLMARAVENTDYACAAPDLLKGANMWFFVQDDIGGTIKAFNQFCKENDKIESHAILGGITEGTVYDKAGIDAIGKLPSKLELYAQIAGSVQAVTTKLARVIKANPEKLARAIKLATLPENDDSKKEQEEDAVTPPEA
jgi:large subunit ribosomal protein L10